MAHPFHKSAKNISGLPNRVSNNIWNKLKKFAHDVWEIDGSGEEPEVVRKRTETAVLDFDSKTDSHSICESDLVLLLLGGRQLEARVLAKWDDDTLSLASEEGYLDNIDQAWVSKIAQEDPPPSSRAITREDIPAQPGPTPAGPSSRASNDLEKLLQNRGGHAAVQLDPSGASVLELKQVGPGQVHATLWHTSTIAAHQGTYGSIAQVLQSMSIQKFEKEVPVAYLKRK